MKIQGPNLTNLNAYKNLIQKSTDHKQNVERKDQLNISSEAKQLQESKSMSKERATYVQEIKLAVESGEYQINHDKAAQKMIDFWSKSK